MLKNTADLEIIIPFSGKKTTQFLQFFFFPENRDVKGSETPKKRSSRQTFSFQKFLSISWRFGGFYLGY